MIVTKVRDTVRDFFRKHDEVVSPIFRFFWTLLVFSTIQKLFNYSDLGAKKEVTLLLAVLAAVVPDSFLFLLAGLLIGLHCFTVSLFVGAEFVVIYLIMYVVYLRFFPNHAYVMFLVPIFYMLNMPFAGPILIALIAGFAGMIPAVFGIVLYYFAGSVKEISALLASEDVENEIQAFKKLSEILIGNKDIYTAAVIFVITIAVTSILMKFRYNYSLYIAMAGGTIINIIGAIFAGYITNHDIAMDMIVFGSFIGLAIGLILRFFQGMLDYGHVERVQFEDDDYYYYVRAVPKLGSEKRRAEAKKAIQKKGTAKSASKSTAKASAKPADKKPLKKVEDEVSDIDE